MSSPRRRVRIASPDDARALAQVHVRSWQTTYRGQMPDAFLDTLEPAERAARWKETLTAENPDSVTLVIEDDRIRGFASVLRGSDGSSCELAAIYLDPEAIGRGLGWSLHEAAIDALRELGCESATLWVHPDNDRARRFYEAAGWLCDGTEKTEPISGVEVPHVRYSRAL